MAQLQCPRQGKHERYVLLGGQLLADNLDMGRRTGGQSAGKGGVAVDVELEQVEEGIADKVDGAVDLALGAVVELEGFAGLVADGEGDPVELVVCLFNVFAGVTGDCLSVSLDVDRLERKRERERGMEGRAYELRFMHSTWMGAP
jgi:hypothetical protein